MAILGNLLATTTGNNFISGTIKENCVRYLSKLQSICLIKTSKEKKQSIFFKYVSLVILFMYFIEKYSIFHIQQ